jgi:threonine dehydrogenase-like Zn-dependent dehydrogenase
MMRGMRHLVVEQPGRVAWQDAPDPEPTAEGAVVRPLAVSRCDLDAPMAAFGLFPPPIAVGHEAVAEVVAVGEGVRDRRVGERVVVPFQVSCGACGPCGRGRYAACTTYRAPAGGAFGFGAAGGGHPGAVADLLAVPHADHLLLPCPDAIPDEAACILADNGVDGYRAVAPGLAEDPGAAVLVVGGLAPSVGLVAVLAATALGAAAVTYVDDDADRLAAAAALGADPIDVAGGWPDALPKAGVVVENTGTPEGLAAAVRATEPYGRCTGVAIHFRSPVPLPLLQMYTKGITFHTSRADARRLLPEALDLAGRGVLDLTRLPLTERPMAEAAERWLEPAAKLVLRAG